MLSINIKEKIKQKYVISETLSIKNNKSNIRSPRVMSPRVMSPRVINNKLDTIKNIPVSNSILYDVEYNNTVALYSTYKDTTYKRRSYSEKNNVTKE